MKVVIAGTRTLKVSVDTIFELLSHFDLERKILQVVSGGCEGVDQAGENFAEVFLQSRSAVVPNIHRELPDREKYGNNAYHIRNKKMAAYGDALLLIWDGKSDGATDMKRCMLELKKPVYEVILRKHNVKEEE